jgi:hypothetical protein
MMKKRLLLYTTLVLAAFSAFSCKKKEEETVVKPYLYCLEFELATFARPGQTFTLKPHGVYYTEEKPGVEKYTYKWKVNSGE